MGYRGEAFDTAIGQQYLRARYYNPNNGRFNRLDPFAGNLADPQSLHKYLYTHGDPVNGIDPTGLSVSVTTSMNTVTVGTTLASQRLAGVAATIFAAQSIQGSIQSQTLTRVARQLDSEVITRTDFIKKKKRNPSYRYFVHGTTANFWSENITQIDPTYRKRGKPGKDFGVGFYTFVANKRGVEASRAVQIFCTRMIRRK